LDESTGLEVKDDWITGVNPETSLQSIITYQLEDQATIDDYQFDLLTQWRILITRLGCLGSPSSDYVSGVRDYAREFLHRHLDDTYTTLRHHGDDLIDSSNPIDKFKAIGLLLYWQTYLYVNAQFLNIWPLPPRPSVTSVQLTHDQLTLELFENLQARVERLQDQVHRAIDQLNLF
jgi:hypothetical protein